MNGISRPRSMGADIAARRMVKGLAMSRHRSGDVYLMAYDPVLRSISEAGGDIPQTPHRPHTVEKWLGEYLP